MTVEIHLHPRAGTLWSAELVFLTMENFDSTWCAAAAVLGRTR